MAHCCSKVSMQWHPWERKQTWSESSKFCAANFFISEAFEAKHWMVLRPKEGTNLNLKMEFSANCFVIWRHSSPSIEFCYKTTIRARRIENSYQVRKNWFPHTQLKLVHQIYDQHYIWIKSKVAEFLHKRILGEERSKGGYGGVDSEISWMELLTCAHSQLTK